MELLEHVPDPAAILFNIKKAVPNETNKIKTSIKNTIQRGRYLKLEILRKLSPLVILFLELLGIVFRSLFN